MFDPVDPKQSLPDVEEGILQYWKEEDIFKRSIKQRKVTSTDLLDHNGEESNSKGVFSFYDGPPFATGLPHYGHLLAGTIKDVIPRYQAMQGKFVERRFGWDCHGLPVETLVEKEHGISGSKDIEKIGTAKFNELCRNSVQRYTKEWKEVVERMGRWVDMDWDYRTMDPEYMESIWWVFNELFEKDLIVEGHKPMHVCPRCRTPLSNFEVTQGYKDLTDHSVTAKFELVDEPGTYVLAWTTTPWTLPGNLLLAINTKLDYVQVECEGAKYILAKDLVEQVFKGKEVEKETKIKAKDLLGKKYKPLFPYFAEQYKESGFYITEGDFVSAEDGTGVVHIAPGFGEDDYNLGQQEGLELLQHVTMDGTFTDAVTDFAGEYVKPGDDPTKADQKIAAKLKEDGTLFATEKYKHTYPHCWRCNDPLINYATSSWFVAVEKIKEKMLANNAKTEWVPAHVRDGRFGKWLEGARDWAISRNRYWGTPLPIWRCEETGEIEVIGSRNELMQRSGERFTKITAIRHGESEGNLVPIYQGKEPGTDLTKTGKEQAAATGTKLQSENITKIYCSPLARTQQTAAILAEHIDAEVIVDERLREVQFGEYEGKTIDFNDLAFVKAKRAHKMQTESPESIYHFPGMETWAEVQARMKDFMDETIKNHPGEHIVIVTHADPIQNLRHFFNGEDPLKISHQPYPQYAEPFVFYWDNERKAQMDLHKDSVDAITWEGPNGQVFKRIPEVLDCWFESGSMPYAQSHFPFSTGDAKYPPGFPADFIAEGIDQTRGWFYTLMVLASGLFDEPAFQNCVVNGIVLAEDGKKMSKSLKNYPDPMELVGKYGADAIRFTLMSSPAVRGEDLRMSEKLVEESLRSVLLPLWNTYSFFVTYANAAEFEAVDTRRNSTHPLDTWIKAEVQDLANRMTEELDGYDLSATCNELHETIDALTNWYIRLSRRRFAGKAAAEEASASAEAQIDSVREDQLDALHTLHDVLLTLSQLLAPFCPFITEAIYLNLVGEDHASVHLTDWPETRDLDANEQALLQKTRLQRTIVSLGLSVRGEQKIKVRQPLARATVAVPPALAKEVQLNDDDLKLLKQELNVKDLDFTEDAGSLAVAIAQVDARKVGPRLGGRVQEIIQAGKEGEFSQEDDGSVRILDEVLTGDEVQIVYRGAEGQNVAADRGVVVSIDTTITPELECEGTARDLIRTVQRLRKEEGLEFTDLIYLSITGADDVLKDHQDLIAHETNSIFQDNSGKAHEVEMGESAVQIQFEKK